MFFLVWGFKVRFRTLLEGVFFCQVCGGDRPFQQKQGKRWFTLFWLPLIPLKDVGEPFVECTTCHNAYRTSVLNQPTSAALSEHLVSASRAALAWLLRSIPRTPAAIAVALDVLSSAANRPWTEPELEADVAGLDVSGLPNQLSLLAGALNDHGRESFLAGCTRVAAANGPIPDGARTLLDNIAASLTMTPAHAHGVIAQIVEQTSH